MYSDTKTPYYVCATVWTAINPFIPVFLKWTLPFLNLDLSTDAKGFQYKIKKQTGKQCRSRYGSLWTISSGSTLFVQVLVYKGEKVNCLLVCIAIAEWVANSIDSDQMSPMVSDLGLQFVQWTLITTTAFVLKDVAIKMNLLFYRILNEQINM